MTISLVRSLSWSQGVSRNAEGSQESGWQAVECGVREVVPELWPQVPALLSFLFFF